jgi:hypothetical protein
MNTEVKLALVVVVVTIVATLATLFGCTTAPQPTVWESSLCVTVCGELLYEIETVEESKENAP